MSMVKVKLVGSKRYSYKGETFLRNQVAMVSEEKAILLLRSVDEHNRPYFRQVSETGAAAVVAAAKPGKGKGRGAKGKPAKAPVSEVEIEEEEEEADDDGGDSKPTGQAPVEV